MAFKTMYPAVAGSPTTTTENTFVAGTTTSLTVSQGSVLAAAPNLATITAADGRFVTVSYTSKSGNTISGLMALEGDKTGTFATGSIIARRYSAVDDSAVKDNIGEIYDNMITAIKANGTALAIVDKAVNIPVAGDDVYGLIVRPTSSVIDVYVSPDGDDSTGTGGRSKPWRTLNYAISQQNVRLFDGNKQYRIHVAPGDYSKISVSYKDNIVIFIDGTVNISGDVNTITRSNIYIDGVTGNNPTLNIIGTSSSSMGIRLHGNSYLHIARLNMNISNVQYGIGSYVLALGNVGIGMNTLMLERAPTNITATTAAIFESQSGLNVYADGAITVDSPIGLRLNSGYPCISIVKSITNTSGTAYAVTSPAVLSINGKWVNQS